MSRAPRHLGSAPHRQSGLTLIELMVALVLGLIVSTAAVGVFITNGRTTAASDNLARVQENSNMAFEFMVRDLREAGGNPCTKKIPVGNVITNAATTWWANWNGGLRGYDNGALAGTTAGTDAVEVMYGTAQGATVVSHDPASATFSLLPLRHGFNANDLLMVCDYSQATIFQMTSPAGTVTNGSVVHTNGVGSPGNCSKGLGFRMPMDCSATGSAYQYEPNSMVVRMYSTRWYIAPNGRGGQSLFRVALRGNALGVAEEVAEGVTDMQLTYVLSGGTNYISGASIPAARWRDVIGVRLNLTIQSAGNVSTDGTPIVRQLEHTVALRNRQE